MKSRVAAVSLFAVIVSVVSVIAVSSQSAPAAQAAPPTPKMVGPVAPPATRLAKINSAISAAPPSIAQNATIMDMPSMAVLRPGTNGWTCLPDGPSPGVDPMCLDKNGFEWAGAWMSHKDPPKDKMGIGYMLAGGSDASNTDPFATVPKTGDQWVETGPHMMVFNIGTHFDGYPTTAANTKVPYVMFAGTPYAHLMIPVR
jgi:hypothetical protein